MKTTFIFLFTILLTHSALAQERKQSQLINLNRTITKLKPNSLKQAENNIIWADDFSTNDNWVISNNENNTQNWKITTYAPHGAYSSFMGKISSATPNKFALMDSDFVANGKDKQRAILTSAAPIDCSNYEKVYAKFYSYYGCLGSEVFFRVSNNNGETWTDFQLHEDVLDWYLTTNPETIYLDITDIASGHENVLIQFYYNGLEENWGLAWLIDDVKIYEPQGVDADILSLNNYWLMGTTENFELSATLQNFGATVLNSITFNYQLNEFKSGTETINNLNIKPFEKYELKHSELFKFSTEGNFTPTINITHINEIEFPISIMGDYIEVYNNDGKNALIGELFTSSTCNPCAAFNPFYDFVQSLVSPKLLNTIKYQMNWPDNGDPYYTKDGEIRKNYYNVTGVPSLYINGTNIDINNYGLDYIRNSLKQSSNISLEVSGNINDSQANLELGILSSNDLTGKYLFISVNEKQTHNNMGTNGETEFNHVLMKMLSGDKGIDLSNLLLNETKRFNFSEDLSYTNIEEYNDLEAVAFVQDIYTGEILQSTSYDLSWEESISNINESMKNSITIYPNPASDFFTIDTNEDIEIYIYNVEGKLIYNEENFASNKLINISNQPEGIYVITIRTSYQISTRKLVISR